MKGGIVSPKRLVDVSRLPGLDRIEPLPDGGTQPATALTPRRASLECPQWV
jgi:hypothetical protein